VRAAVALIVLLLAACAMLSSHAHKPFELRIDDPDAKPAAWPTNAAAEPRMEWSDQYACMRLIVPYEVTTERRKGETRT
jgi:hypothetical protein